MQRKPEVVSSGKARASARISPAVEQFARKLQACASYIQAATGWRRRLIAAGAGAASMLALAPFYFWPVLFLTLPVAVFLLDGPSPPSGRLSALLRWLPTPQLRSAARDGWWFAFGYHFFGLFWIGEAFLVEAHIFGWLLPFAVTIMPAGLALFSCFSFALARAVWPNGPVRIISLAIAIAIGEYLRGHMFTGFPWNVLGYALTNDDWIIQAAGIIGIYGLTALVVVICATPLVALIDFWVPNQGEDPKTASQPHQRGMPPALPIGILTLAPCLALYAYGFWVLPTQPLAVVADVKLRIVQPSVPQHEKWAQDKQGEIFHNHLSLSHQDESGNFDGAKGITHIVWPEAAMPFLPLATPQALSAIGKMLPENTYLMAGALRLEDSSVGDEIRPSVKPVKNVFNSILVFNPDGSLLTLYDKIHLVPFGEYLPFTETLNWLGLETITRIRGGFSVGPKPRPLLSLPGLPAIGPLICYEAIFPSQVVQGDLRPSLLVNVTNDGWFGNLTGPFQHFQQSRVRAVEEGLPLVRAANNGVSALIDPYGRVTKTIGLNVRGTIDVTIPKPAQLTLYARFGDYCLLSTIAFLCGLGLLFVVYEARSATREA